MGLAESFIQKASANPKRIVYPEGSDERIIEAALKSAALGVARPVVVGTPERVGKVAAATGLPSGGVSCVSPDADPDRLERYADVYAKAREMRTAIARKLVRKPLAFCGMMVKCGDADGMVGGVDCATALVIQAAAVTIGYQPGISTPSSLFAMVVPEYLGEKDKVLIFADCAVAVQPDARQLAEIAVVTGRTTRALFGIEPKVALLSFSTRGSASHADVDKVIEATRIARELEGSFPIDGELQADSAIVPRVAQKKVKESQVAGHANVLVFPDLDAGNMAYKLVQYLAGAVALGPVLQGFARPVSDLSRGASVDDIVGVTAITVVQGA